MSARQKLKLAGVLLLTVCTTTGCGSSPGEDKVTGSVTVTIKAGGAPVTGGFVNLANPATGEGGGGELNEAGVATIEQVTVGDYTVTVLPPQPDPVPVEPGQEPPPNPDDGTIPQQYRSESTSPLKATVTEGDNSFEFDLEE